VIICEICGQLYAKHPSNREICGPFFAKRTQFSPPQADSTPYTAKRYRKSEVFSRSKNEPKRTQISIPRTPMPGLVLLPKNSEICEISVKNYYLFLQNEPNFPRFYPKNRDSGKKQSQTKLNKAKQSQSKPIKANQSQT